VSIPKLLLLLLLLLLRACSTRCSCTSAVLQDLLSKHTLLLRLLLLCFWVQESSRLCC
jgi:hypothetical protein